jgi:hypothetical protein
MLSAFSLSFVFFVYFVVFFRPDPARYDWEVNENTCAAYARFLPEVEK